MKKPETNMTDKTFETEYTEEDLQEMREAGYAEDELPSVGVHKFRRARHIAPRKEQKIKITILLDADVLDYFKARAAQPDAAPYQTQINIDLRRVMESSSQISSITDKIRESLLNDVDFIERLRSNIVLAQ